MFRLGYSLQTVAKFMIKSVFVYKARKDISPEAMELLIDFCYTTTITIEEENVQQLLPAACLLQMTQIQQYCCEFLSKQLHPSNCLGTYFIK